MSTGHFHRPPPVFIGGRQPYAPALGIPQSGPAPAQPPPRAGIYAARAMWEPGPPIFIGGSQPYTARRAIPQTGVLPDAPPRKVGTYPALALWAPVPPVFVGARQPCTPRYAIPQTALTPPPLSRTGAALATAAWAHSPLTIISLTSIAPFADAPEAPSQPQPATTHVFFTIREAWNPAWYTPPKLKPIAAITAAQPNPDAPPVTSRAAFYELRRLWDPPHYALPEGSNFAPLAPLAAPVLLSNLPDRTAFNGTGTHIFGLGAAYFSGATSYSIAPALEAGWSFNTTTGDLTIDTDANGTFGPFTVTATNSGGSTPSNGFTVTVMNDPGGSTGIRKNPLIMSPGRLIMRQ